MTRISDPIRPLPIPPTPRDGGRSGRSQAALLHGEAHCVFGRPPKQHGEVADGTAPDRQVEGWGHPGPAPKIRPVALIQRRRRRR